MTHKSRVLELLSDGKPHSHHELYALHVIAHSRIADLRRDGHQIEQWRDGDTYLYRLVSLEQPEVDPSTSPIVGAGETSTASGNSNDDELSLFQLPSPGAYADGIAA